MSSVTTDGTDIAPSPRTVQPIDTFDVPATPIVSTQSPDAQSHRAHLDALRAEANFTSIAPSAAAASSSSSSSIVPSKPIPPFSSIDLIDWKLAETKDGSEYIVFLFEVLFKYPESVLAQAEAGGATLPPTVTVVVGKRFAELHAFHCMLERHFVCLPFFPERTLTRRTDKAFVENRCSMLQSYLRQILIREDILRTGWLQKFLTIPSPGQQIRAARLQQQQRMREQERQKAGLLHAAHATKGSSPAASNGLIAAASGSPTSSPTPSQQQQRSQTLYASKYDSALGGDDGGIQPSSLATGVEIHVTPSSANLLGLLDAVAAEPNGATVSGIVSVEERKDEPSHSHRAGADVDVEDEEEEEGSSEPATTSNSFSHAAQPTSDEPNYDSDDGYERAMSSEPDAERLKRQKSGNRVIDVAVRRSLGPAASTAGGMMTSTDEEASSVPTLPKTPNSVALEFLSRSPVFHMLKFILVDASTLLCIAADQSTVAKMDSWLTGLFGSSAGDKKASGANSTVVQHESQAETTFTSSSSSADVTNPLGALYCFRRRPSSQGLDDSSVSQQSVDVPLAEEFEQVLHIFFPYELSAMEWDSSRRWIYLADVRGAISIFNPGESYDYAIKILTQPIFAEAPITHMKYYESSPLSKKGQGLPGGGLILVSARASDPKQLLTIFDVSSQAILHHQSFQFNTGVNSQALLHSIEVCEKSDRLFIGASDRAISIYDLTWVGTSKSSPPLLHRLANGHSAPILCLSWNPLTQCLASGGEDKAVVLWKVAPKGNEKHTALYAKMMGHHSKVRSVAWSGGTHEYVVSGDDSGHVAVWDPVRRACILAFRGHSESVVNLQMTQHLTLLTASKDKSAKLWQLSQS